MGKARPQFEAACQLQSLLLWPTYKGTCLVSRSMLVGIQPAAPNSMAGLAEWLRRWIVDPVYESSILSSRPKWAVRIRGLPTACNREMRVQVSHRPPKLSRFAGVKLNPERSEGEAG